MSSMYQLLTEECGEVLAIFAYAAYKQHKFEVLSDILSDTGHPATQEDLERFYRIATAPTMRTMYVQQAEGLMTRLMDRALELRQSELEKTFLATQVGKQLDIIQQAQRRKRSWKGWAADVSGNLAVNFVTILVIAALLFGFRGLDQILNGFGRNSGVLSK